MSLHEDAALDRLSLLIAGWDGRRAPAPSVDAIRVARAVVRAGRDQGLPTPRVVADVEGGVAMYYFAGPTMADGGRSRSGGVLVNNDGEAALYLRDRVADTSVIRDAGVPAGDRLVADIRVFLETRVPA